MKINLLEELAKSRRLGKGNQGVIQEWKQGLAVGCGIG
jgi:hypothetical protein